jgi:hypothetical protein
MLTNKIFCIGDGFAHGHIWPEWPQIIQALLPTYDINLISGVGAGNEFLISEFLTYGKSIHSQKIIFQWADANRFDKLVQDLKWDNLGKFDPVYHFNFYQFDDRKWWLSSASNDSFIQLYHNFYIQDKQAQLRLQNQKTLIENYLQHNQCTYYFTSTHNQITFSQDSRFNTDIKEVQPIPIVHFYFATEVLLPNIGIEVDVNRYRLLKHRILDQIWIPYDPDRIEIWKQISDL